MSLRLRKWRPRKLCMRCLRRDEGLRLRKRLNFSILCEVYLPLRRFLGGWQASLLCKTLMSKRIFKAGA